MFQVIYTQRSLKEKKCDKVEHNYQTRVLENQGKELDKSHLTEEREELLIQYAAVVLSLQLRTLLCFS